MTDVDHRRTRVEPSKADSDHVRRQNRALVLAALRRLAPIARVDLGQFTELSPATITAITADLISEGLVTSVPDPNADAQDLRGRRGRPRILLQLEPGAVFILCIKIALNSVTLALSNFASAIVAQQDLKLNTLAETRVSFPATLVERIRAFLEEAGVSLNRVAEISIASQGFVDTQSGSVMWSPAFSERDIKIVAPLENALGIPSALSNDANMIAQALNTGDPKTYKGTFAVLFVDHGVGMGLFIGDKLHHGANGAAAEFGHMNHVPGGPLCRCGRRGCLEAFAANYAIYRDANHMSPDTDPVEAIPTPGDLVRFEAMAYAGDDHMMRVYTSVGRALGFGLARLMALINPERIVLTGTSIRAYALFEPAMRAAISEALVEDLSRFTVIETLNWDRDMILTGLVADALARLDRDIFSNPSNASRYRDG